MNCLRSRVSSIARPFSFVPVRFTSLVRTLQVFLGYADLFYLRFGMKYTRTSHDNPRGTLTNKQARLSGPGAQALKYDLPIAAEKRKRGTLYIALTTSLYTIDDNPPIRPVWQQIIYIHDSNRSVRPTMHTDRCDLASRCTDSLTRIYEQVCKDAVIRTGDNDGRPG